MRSSARPTKVLNETPLERECFSRDQDIHPIGEHGLGSTHALPSGNEFDRLLWVRPITEEVDPSGMRAEPCRDEIIAISAIDHEDACQAAVVNRQFRAFLTIQGQNHGLDLRPRPFAAFVPVDVGSKQGVPPFPNPLVQQPAHVGVPVNSASLIRAARLVLRLLGRFAHSNPGAARDNVRQETNVVAPAPVESDVGAILLERIARGSEREAGV